MRRGDVDRVELFELYRERAAGDSLNAFLSVADDAPAAAPARRLAACRSRVKDLFCVEGVETRASSKILAGYLPPYTATAIAKLAGSWRELLGKTNMDEFAMGSSNENSAFRAPCRIPWDESRVPGGSSGGSAAAVAAGLAPWAPAPTPVDRSASPLHSAASSD